MVKKLLLIPLILFISVNFSGCASILKSYQSSIALKEGELYANKRQYGKAEATLIKSLKDNPENAKAWIALGNIYFTIDNYAEATFAYHEALKYDRDAYSAYSSLWKVRLEESGYTEEAKKEVKKEIEDFISPSLEDKNPERLIAAYQGLGFLHEYDQASKVAEEILTSGPDEEHRAGLATATFEEILRERDVEKRLSMIEKFQKLFPFSKELYMVNSIRLSIAAKDLKDKEKLFEYGEKWIEGEPDNRRANFSVGHWYTEEDIALDRAVLYIKKALELIEDPDPADKPDHYPESEWRKDLRKSKGTYYDTLGWAYYKLGKYKKAEKAYRKATQYLDFDQNLYYHLGLLLEEKGDTEGAIHSYVQALKSGENKEAEERLQKIVSSSSPPKSPFTKRGFRGTTEMGFEPLYKSFARREGVTTFTDVTEAAGLSAVKVNRLAWGDYNNDGYEDILFNGAILFKNNGDGTFMDVTTEAGISPIPGANGGVWGDFDNDGYIDFYTFASGKETTDRFWRNNKDGTFTDITMTAVETPDNYPTEAAAWGDYDKDGFIDLYIANYEKPLLETVDRARCLPDRLLHNNGNGTFTDVSTATGIISPENMCGRGVNWGDFDNDGDTDIYVANYRLDPNFLWRNNGDGTFTNVAAEVGVEGSEEEGAYGHSIGAEWGDFNNDGYLDLFVSNLAHPRYLGFSDKSMLLENQGPPPFSSGERKEVRDSTGDFRFINRFADSGIRFEETSADPSLADYDNDGILDLYFTSTYRGKKSFLYRGNGDGTFADVTWLAGVRVDNGWGNAFADYDNDGDLDLLVASSDGVRLFRNDGNSNHWLQVRVVGRESNRSGIGARVMIAQSESREEVGGISEQAADTPSEVRSRKSEVAAGFSLRSRQIREVQGGKGSGSQHSLPVEFGLDSYSGPLDVEVKFPSGKIIQLKNVKPDQMIVVEEH